VIRLLAKLFLRVNGWEFEGRRPAARRFVLIAAPHTSNWDLAYLLALGAVVDVKVHWMGKHQLFRGPMGWLMRRVGGVPVRRDRSNDLVTQMARVLERAPAMALTVPPEATRDYVPFWKSGFYHIARTAQVPIVMGYLDYARKRGGFGPELIPTGDVRGDMDEIRAFYADKTARYPDRFGEPRLKEES
jgi:1-acyl-sn-glycerol-3-phosphate acyltransferase